MCSLNNKYMKTNNNIYNVNLNNKQLSGLELVSRNPCKAG